MGVCKVMWRSLFKPQEAQRKSEGVAPLIFNFGARWCGWPTPLPGRFTPRKGWLGSRTDLDGYGGEKIVFVFHNNSTKTESCYELCTLSTSKEAFYHRGSTAEKGVTAGYGDVYLEDWTS
jgi:hypothetical protein